MNISKVKYLLLSFIFVLILSGCSKEGIYSDKGQVFRKVIPQDMSTLDTALITDAVSGDISNQVFEGLFTLDENDKAKLALAKELPKKSNGGKTLTFKLRNDAKWSNGDPVTANDFVYAWRKLVDPKTGSEYAYIMSDIENADSINAGKLPVEKLGIKALSKYELEIKLKRPIPYINELLALSNFYPQNEKVAKKFGEKYGLKPQNAVYNGPFKVDTWRAEDKILLSKNNFYWDKKNVKLDKVNYKILKDKQAGASLFETGSVDDTFTAKGVAKLSNGDDYASSVNSPLKYDKKKALEYWEKAKKELNIKKFTFSMNTEDTPDSKISAEYIKAQIEKNLPGVKMKIRQLPFKQRLSEEFKMTYESSLTGWAADYPDPTTYLSTMTKDNPQNNTDWGNKKYDDYLGEINGKLLGDVSERDSKMKEDEELLLKEAPLAPIYQKGEAHLTNPKVKGLQYHVVGPDTTLKYVYIEK